MPAFSAKSAPAAATATVPTANPRIQWRRHHASATSGATRTGTGRGLEYVAMPSSTAAAKSVQCAVSKRVDVRLKRDVTCENVSEQVRPKPDPTADPTTTGVGSYLTSAVASAFRRTPSTRTSLYNHRKYATRTIARLKTSGIR